MTALNNQGVVSYDTTRAGFVEGQVTDMSLGKMETYRNPKLPQINTVTISGFGADADSITLSITLPNGTVVAVTTTRASSVPVDDAAAAVALRDLVNAHASLNGHVEATAAAAVLTLTFQHPATTYAVSTTVVACVATVAASQAAGGSAFGIGRFTCAGVDVGGQPALRALTSSDTDEDVMGVTIRGETEQWNLQGALATDVDTIPIGALATVMYEGRVAMRNNGSVAAVKGGQIWAVVDATGGDEVGEARSDASGVAELWTMTPTAAELDFLILIEWTNPAGVKESVPILSANPDGSATATEIANGWRTAIAAAQADGLLAGFTAGGTATLTLTGPAGQGFRVSNVGVGVVATTQTTPVVQYAIPLNPLRFHWAEAVAVGAVGRVQVRA